MSWQDDREERRRYENDVFYEAWRRGYNPDRFAECAIDCYYEGRSPEACVSQTARRIEYQREQRLREQEEAQHYAEMERQHYEELARQQPDDQP